MSTAITRLESQSSSGKDRIPDPHDVRLVVELAKAATLQMDNGTPTPPGNV